MPPSQVITWPSTNQPARVRHTVVAHVTLRLAPPWMAYRTWSYSRLAVRIPVTVPAHHLGGVWTWKRTTKCMKSGSPTGKIMVSTAGCRLQNPLTAALCEKKLHLCNSHFGRVGKNRRAIWLVLPTWALSFCKERQTSIINYSYSTKCISLLLFLFSDIDFVVLDTSIQELYI